MNEKGFTLIELVMVIVLLAIVAGTVGMLITQGASLFSDMEAAREITAEGRLAVERITREIRLLRCSNSTPASCTPDATDITTMNATELKFVNADNEVRWFKLSGAELRLRIDTDVADPVDVLAGNVTALTFAYLKSDGTAAVIADEVWTITAELTLTRANQSLSFKAGTHPRSFY